MASKARRRVALAQPEWSNLLTEEKLAGVDRQGDEASGASRTPCTRGLEILTEGQLAGVNATISARRVYSPSASLPSFPGSSQGRHVGPMLEILRVLIQQQLEWS